jgi:hypothetical protein
LREARWFLDRSPSHHVTIHATTVREGTVVDPKSFEEKMQMSRKAAKILVAGKVTWIVPEKYSRTETSDLMATVGSSPNEIDFDLRAGDARHHGACRAAAESFRPSGGRLCRHRGNAAWTHDKFWTDLAPSLALADRRR